MGHRPGARSVPETELSRLRAQIAELQQQKSEVEAFAAVAAHELLTPVVMIDAYATMVAERLDPDQHADSLQDLDALRSGAARSRLLVETLLHHARSREREPLRRPVDLNAVVRGCLELLAPEIVTRRADVRVAELPEVLGEEALIGALLGNLISNALKYGPRERPLVVVDADRAPPFWRLSVRSPGPPVPAADRERIFEPYRRAQGERRAPGTGLGLAICRFIAERHGGEIRLEPTPEGENRFWVTLLPA